LRIAHISDLHLADRSRYPRNGFTKRDCDRHSPRLLKGLLAALRESQVDHLVVTGDLTLSAEVSELERAVELLAPWARERKLTVLPGNHDVWTAESASTGRFLRLVGVDGLGASHPEKVYPHLVELGPDLVLIALDSARPGEEPHTTPGMLGSEQIQTVRAWVRERTLVGTAVILALHHHLVLPPARVPSDAYVARMPLADADKLVRLIAELPVALVLHGHRHTAFRVDLPGASGPTPVLCGGSGSRDSDEPVRRARAFLYQVDGRGLRSVEALVASVE
jgi:3',5'-cyclic AMP phosphodiesterase CpdA